MCGKDRSQMAAVSVIYPLFDKARLSLMRKRASHDEVASSVVRPVSLCIFK